MSKVGELPHRTAAGIFTSEEKCPGANGKTAEAQRSLEQH